MCDVVKSRLHCSRREGGGEGLLIYLLLSEYEIHSPPLSSCPSRGGGRRKRRKRKRRRRRRRRTNGVSHDAAHMKEEKTWCTGLIFNSVPTTHKKVSAFPPPPQHDVFMVVFSAQGYLGEVRACVCVYGRGRLIIRAHTHCKYAANGSGFLITSTLSERDRERERQRPAQHNSTTAQQQQHTHHRQRAFC